MTILNIQEKGASTYSAEIRAVIRGLWTGAIDYDQAFDLMMFTIRIGLMAAWHEGLEEVGLLPADMAPMERIHLEQEIQSEYRHIDGFLEHIEQNSKANGGKLGSLWPRGDLWINRYRDIRNQAKQSAKNDPKLEWVLGPTEHCVDCLRLSGKVKRASQWARYGIRPQDPALACGGFNCKCELVPTEQHCSPGPLPRLSG